MRVKLLATVLALGVGASVAIACQVQPAPQQPAERQTARARSYPAVQALADRYVAEDKASGIVLAIGEGDAPPTFASAGRLSDAPDAAKAGPDSLWRIYSMTKPVTGIAAMLLVEDGKLELDQPIGDVIPAFKTMRVATDPEKSLASVPARTPITVRHLLTHTAGLSYALYAKGALLKESERLGVLPFAVNAETEAQARRTRPASLAAFADRAAQLPLIAQPGTRWSYSIGLDVLARVIEVAAGMPYERFVQTRLFDPLKMNSTMWQVKPGDVGRFAANAVWMGDTRVPFDPAARSVFLQPPSFAYGGAGLVSSARDYDRFLHMLANGGTLDGVRVMKPETVRLALSDLLPNGVTFPGIGRGTAAPNGTQGYGAGGAVYLVDVAGGPSKGTFGWGGAAGTLAWVDPVRRLRGTVMVNYFPESRWPLREDVMKALAADRRPR